MKQVIIFGASGFIGKHLVSHLSDKGFQVTPYSSKTCNLLDAAQTASALEKCDDNTAIIVCSGIGRTEAKDEATSQKNVTMIENIISALEDKTIASFIFLSSVCIYGLPVKKLPIDESTPENPCDHYGASKLKAEKLLSQNLSAKTSVTLLRLPGVFGEGDNFNSAIGKLTKAYLKGEVKISGDGQTERDLIEVNNISYAIEQLLKKPYNGVLNLASGQSRTIESIVDLIGGCLEKPAKITLTLEDSERNHDLIFSTELLNEKLNVVFDFDREIAIYVRQAQNLIEPKN